MTRNLANCSLFVFIIFIALRSSSSIQEFQNVQMQLREKFYVIDVLSDNEKETRVKWDDLMGKETTLNLENGLHANSTSGLISLWQLTDGKKFIQMIYSGTNLFDCEYLNEKGEILEDFVDKFTRDYSIIRQEVNGRNDHQRFLVTSGTLFKPNITLSYIKHFGDMPKRFMKLMNFKKMQKKCSKLHNHIRHLYSEKSNSEDPEESSLILNANENTRSKRQTESWFLAPNTKWCGKGRSADNYKELGASKSDVCCRKHDHCRMSIPGFQTKYGLFNHSPFTMSNCRCDRRRDLNIFIIPHTKYCGAGWSARKYSEIGGFSRTDKCCRSHDFCPHWIGSFEKKWSLFNWSYTAIMHCKCDDRFRTCLKMADSPDANMVGKLFFNIVQIKCFVLKPEKACILYSWWGKCLKFKVKKKAYIRDNQKY